MSAPADGRLNGRVGSRLRRRRLATLLAVAAITISLGTPASQATAPTPATPPPAAQGGPIVPAGSSSYTEAQIEQIARQLLANPIGEHGIDARIALGAPTDGSKNVTAQWFDMSVMPNLYDALLRGMAHVPAKYNPASYGIRWQGLQYPGNEALFDALGKGPNARLLEVDATNIPRDQGDVHAEAVVILLRLRPLIEAILSQNYSPAQAKALTSQILALTALAIYSDRAACAERCAALTKDFQHVLTIAAYGTPEQRAASAQVVAAVLAKATSIRKDAELTRQIEAAVLAGDNKALGALEQTNLAKVREVQQRLNGPCGGLGPQAAGPVSGGGRVTLLAAAPLAAPPLAGPCGEGTESGLGSVLTAPADLDKYGGVDFSTLELRYLSDPPGGSGVQYSYSAGSLAAGYRQNQALGNAVVRTAGDDLRTWLVLSPQAFWVNLDPREPDRIIDPALGRTNAGRALLQADLAMKRTEGTLLNPDTPLGARYWKELVGPTGSACFASRMWIVPGDVQVREDGDSLYVLNAALDVKTESEHAGPSTELTCKDNDPAADARNERLERTLILPRVVRAVNTAPEYAPLRRAFVARVVAQWIRDRHQAGRRTSFDQIIDSGDLGRAVLPDGWRPQQVYDAYLRSIRNHEFSYQRTTHQGRTTIVAEYTFGGVDFSNLRPTAVSAADMSRQYPQLPDTVRSSLGQPSTGLDGELWLGGSQPVPGRNWWTRMTGRVGNLTAGTLGVLAVIVLAVLALAFGFRGAGRRRRPAPRLPG